jgi:hypothetical protein
MVVLLLVSVLNLGHMGLMGLLPLGVRQKV